MEIDWKQIKSDFTKEFVEPLKCTGIPRVVRNDMEYFSWLKSRIETQSVIPEQVKQSATGSELYMKWKDKKGLKVTYNKELKFLKSGEVGILDNVYDNDNKNINPWCTIIYPQNDSEFVNGQWKSKGKGLYAHKANLEDIKEA